MANEVTKLSNVINPQVMGAMIEAKISALCKLTPYAKVDTTLQGVPGDTKTVPSWNYIGDAQDFDPENTTGAEIETAKLTASSTTFTIKSIVGKVDNDVLAAAYTSTNTFDGSDAAIGYKPIVKAVTSFEDEEDGIEKVMFIHPKQETELLQDADFISADKFESGVAVRGSIGKIAGCWIKKSKKVKTETSGSSQTAKTYYLNPIIKMEPDSPETEYTEDELPALTIFLKKDTQVDHEWFPKKQRHDVTAAKYYGVALTNAAKVVIAKFKA